jgi:hypothetical protein
LDQSRKQIENTFRLSNSPDELFDAFHYALEMDMNDIEVYRILLANPFLSSDEVKMFTEKLSRVMPDNSYDLFMWSAKIFENQKEAPDKLECAINYYRRAAKFNPASSLPLIRLLGLFNYDYDSSMNEVLINFAKDCVAFIKDKSKVYISLADIYKRKGELNLEAKYRALAEKIVGEEE